MLPVLHQPRHPAHLLARWENLIIDVFVGAPGLQDLQAIRHLYDHPDTPARFGLLVVLSPSLRTPPEADVRRAINGQLHQYQSRIMAYATAVELDGLLGTAARAVVKGMQMLEPWSFPVTVTDSVTQASRFLCKHLPPNPALGVTQLVDAVEWVRANGQR